MPNHARRASRSSRAGPLRGQQAKGLQPGVACDARDSVPTPLRRMRCAHAHEVRVTRHAAAPPGAAGERVQGDAVSRPPEALELGTARALSRVSRDRCSGVALEQGTPCSLRSLHQSVERCTQLIGRASVWNGDCTDRPKVHGNARQCTATSQCPPALNACIAQDRTPLTHEPARRREGVRGVAAEEEGGQLLWNVRS